MFRGSRSPAGRRGGGWDRYRSGGSDSSRGRAVLCLLVGVAVCAAAVLLRSAASNTDSESAAESRVGAGVGGAAGGGESASAARAGTGVAGAGGVSVGGGGSAGALTKETWEALMESRRRVEAVPAPDKELPGGCDVERSGRVGSGDVVGVAYLHGDERGCRFDAVVQHEVPIVVPPGLPAFGPQTRAQAVRVGAPTARVSNVRVPLSQPSGEWKAPLRPSSAPEAQAHVLQHVCLEQEKLADGSTATGLVLYVDDDAHVDATVVAAERAGLPGSWHVAVRPPPLGARSNGSSAARAGDRCEWLNDAAHDVVGGTTLGLWGARDGSIFSRRCDDESEAEQDATTVAVMAAMTNQLNAWSPGSRVRQFASLCVHEGLPLIKRAQLEALAALGGAQGTAIPVVLGEVAAAGSGCQRTNVCFERLVLPSVSAAPSMAVSDMRNFREAIRYSVLGSATHTTTVADARRDLILLPFRDSVDSRAEVFDLEVLVSSLRRFGRNPEVIIAPGPANSIDVVAAALSEARLVVTFAGGHMPLLSFVPTSTVVVEIVRFSASTSWATLGQSLGLRYYQSFGRNGMDGEVQNPRIDPDTGRQDIDSNLVNVRANSQLLGLLQAGGAAATWAEHGVDRADFEIVLADALGATASSERRRYWQSSVQVPHLPASHLLQKLGPPVIMLGCFRCGGGTLFWVLRKLGILYADVTRTPNDSFDRTTSFLPYDDYDKWYRTFQVDHSAASTTTAAEGQYPGLSKYDHLPYALVDGTGTAAGKPAAFVSILRTFAAAFDGRGLSALRFVFLTRDPMERMWSQVRYDYSNGSPRCVEVEQIDLEHTTPQAIRELLPGRVRSVVQNAVLGVKQCMLDFANHPFGWAMGCVFGRLADAKCNPIIGSLYAEQLRALVELLDVARQESDAGSGQVKSIHAAMASACVAPWDDPALRGALSTRRWSPILVKPMNDLRDNPTRIVQDVLEHMGRVVGSTHLPGSLDNHGQHTNPAHEQAWKEFDPAAHADEQDMQFIRQLFDRDTRHLAVMLHE